MTDGTEGAGTAGACTVASNVTSFETCSAASSLRSPSETATTTVASKISSSEIPARFSSSISLSVTVYGMRGPTEFDSYFDGRVAYRLRAAHAVFESAMNVVSPASLLLWLGRVQPISLLC